MSGNSTQTRSRRMGSPSTKQGPIKATLPFGLVHGSPTRSVNNNGRKPSPSSSPTMLWSGDGHRIKTKRSPDLTRSSPERSSPCSPAFKVEHPKPVRLSPASMVKRGSPRDTITLPYLTGHWPRCDIIAPIPSYVLQPQDKATQTPDWDSEESEARKRLSVHKRSSSLSNVDAIRDVRAGIPPPEPKSAFKIIKSRLAKTKEAQARSPSGSQRTSTVQGQHLSFGNASLSTSPSPVGPSKAVTIPVSHIPKARMRGSVEGPNQEIERALRSITGVDGEQLQRTAGEPTPDGHRAPVLELITRSVDTQTPSGLMDKLRISSCKQTSSSWSCSSCANELTPPQSYSEPSSPSSHLATGSPAECGLSPCATDLSRPSSRDETPPAEGCESPSISKESATGDSDNLLGMESPQESLSKCVPSPRPNKSFSFGREPPDGCEKVKLIEEPRSAPPLKEPLLYCPIQRTSQFHIPSVDSAFCPLHKPCMSHQATPAVPALLSTAPEAPQ